MTRDMQDNLEKFIKEHKEEFDDLSPNEAIWNKIDQKLEATPNHFNNMIMWKVAAIILFLFSVGLTLFVNRDYLLNISETAVIYDEEFLNAEAYYAAEINQRQELIKTVAHNLPDVESDFEAEWVLLDKNYKSLKLEYEKNQGREIKSALIQNLRARMSLLNRQIEVLEEIEKNRDFIEI